MGSQVLPDSRAALAGSVATICTSGRASRNIWPTPVSVPPVPPTRDEEVEPLAGEVLEDLGSRGAAVIGGIRLVLELIARNQPCFCASSAAFFTMPVPRSAAGVRMTFAPSIRMTLRRSIENDSAITATNGYPFAAHTIARAMPVLPEVASTTVWPGFSVPLRSASSMMPMARRSFNRAQRVEELALHIHRDVLRRESLDADDGRFTDRSQDVVVDHGDLLRLLE